MGERYFLPSICGFTASPLSIRAVTARETSALSLEQSSDILDAEIPSLCFARVKIKNNYINIYLTLSIQQKKHILMLFISFIHNA